MENCLEPDRPQMTIWRLRIACWVPKATNTHPECVIHIAFQLQQWLRQRVSVVGHTYIARPVKFRLFATSVYLITNI